MNTFLTIWAIAGPIIVAASSALWLRSAQLQDRQYEVHQRRLAREEALEDEQRFFLRTIAEEEKKNLRLVASDFVYCTGEFVDAHLDLCLPEQLPNTAERCAKTKEQFNKISHQLVLMAPDEFSQATIRFQNCAAEFLVVHRAPDEDRLRALTEEYTAAKNEFLALARKTLEVRLF